MLTNTPDRLPTPSISSPVQLDLEVEENGYLRQAIVFKNIGPSEYAGYFLTGKQHALFKIRKQDNQAELYASDGLDTEWAEHWTYNPESRSNGYQELAPREKIEDGLYQVMRTLVDDFVDEWVWFAESPPEDIIIVQQKYERMGLSAHQANIKAEKIGKMGKGASPQGTAYAYTTLDTDCAWIKNVIAGCWPDNNQTGEERKCANTVS